MGKYTRRDQLNKKDAVSKAESVKTKRLQGAEKITHRVTLRATLKKRSSRNMSNKCKGSKSKKFKGFSNIKEKIENGVTTYKCTICTRARAFKTKAHRRYHRFCSNEEKKRYKCYFCGQSFVNKNHFQYHVGKYTNANKRPFFDPRGKLLYPKCGIRSNLEKPYKYQEIQNRPHRCIKCKRAFYYAKDLRRHQLVHTEERNLKCPICEKMHQRKDNLFRHIKNTHCQNNTLRAKQLANEAAEEASKMMKAMNLIDTRSLDENNANRKGIRCITTNSCSSASNNKGRKKRLTILEKQTIENVGTHQVLDAFSNGYPPEDKNSADSTGEDDFDGTFDSPVPNAELPNGMWFNVEQVFPYIKPFRQVKELSQTFNNIKKIHAMPFMPTISKIMLTDPLPNPLKCLQAASTFEPSQVPDIMRAGGSEEEIIIVITDNPNPKIIKNSVTAIQDIDSTIPILNDEHTNDAGTRTPLPTIVSAESCTIDKKKTISLRESNVHSEDVIPEQSDSEKSPLQEENEDSDEEDPPIRSINFFKRFDKGDSDTLNDHLDFFIAHNQQEQSEQDLSLPGNETPISEDDAIIEEMVLLGEALFKKKYGIPSSYHWD